MLTFSASFAVIENLLPILYRREFVREYDQLMADLQRELINELHEELMIQNSGMLEVIARLEQVEAELELLDQWYAQNCLEIGSWQDSSENLEALLESDEMLQACELVLLEMNALVGIIRETWLDNEHFLVHEQVEWFHFRQMRSHHQEHGSVSYLIIESILNHFAVANNVRIWVWDIPAGTLDLGETLFYIEGRSAEMEFMTRLDDTEIGVREQRFHDQLGGFAIAISGTFQPAYRVLTIISTLQHQLLIVMFFVSLIISLLFSRYLAHPIVRLSEESKKLRDLKFDESLKIKRRDEIGDLSNNLNFMSYELKRTLDLLQDANEKLKIEMKREREQERQRRNLFTSISHELKTPITILKGEIGGMIDQVGDYKDRDVYLESTYGWIENLENLVSEILTISRLEGEKMNLDLTHTNISELLNKIYHTHQTLADKQEVLFNHRIEPDLVIKADQSQLQIALSNVINNAIFYTQPKKEVEVKLRQEVEFAILMVTNVGAYIAEDELKHLFEPFYRIDKSRNRHTGGSGLGLFIVKNILDLHRFEYTLRNIENGVRFTIKIPLS